jgi:signal transduction histidine kinase
VAEDLEFFADQFLAMLKHRNAENLVADLVKSMLREYDAEAGAFFISKRAQVHVREGLLTAVRADALNRWEDRVLQRLAAGPWRLEQESAASLAVQPIHSTEEVLLATPLLADAEVVGGAALVFKNARQPAARQRRALALVLAAAVRIIDLLLELDLFRERLSHFGLFYQVGQAMGSTLDMMDLIEYTMQLATSMLDAGASVLMLIDEGTGELVSRFAYGDEGNLLARRRVGLHEGIVGWVATRGTPQLVNDVQINARFDPQADAPTGFLTRSILCVPLRTRDRTIGVLEVLNKRSQEGFDQDDLSLLMTTASQAAIAIENARLFGDLRAQRERIIQAQEDVRRELARNLHDGTVQHLSAIAMGVDNLERLLQQRPGKAWEELQHLRHQVQQAARQARLALFELRPVVLETRGLVAALESYLEQLKGTGTLAIHFKTSDQKLNLDLKVARTVFSIVQEAINNAKKHAGASNLWVQLQMTDSHLEIEVRDDGTGFDLAEVEKNYDQRGSIGLLNMQERAELVDARLDIDSVMLQGCSGTRIRLWVPVGSAERWGDPGEGK